MVSQKQISSWLPPAIELFNKYMPGLDTDAIIFRIVSPKMAEKIRAQLVQELKSPQIEGSPSSMLEFMFGSNGTAILIRQKYIENEHQFQKLIWHELGHAYAYQFEYPGYHLVDATNPTNANLWDCTGFLFGYGFWKEFIAESISCFVASKTFPAIDISNNWYGHKNLLENYLNMALNYSTKAIDDFSLAMYFSHMLMGNNEKQFFEKAQNGGLQVVDHSYSGLGINYRISEPDEIDAYCLRNFYHEEYREALIKIRDFLLPQTKKSNFWAITPDWIIELGSHITYMMTIKIAGLLNSSPQL